MPPAGAGAAGDREARPRKRRRAPAPVPAPAAAGSTAAVPAGGLLKRPSARAQRQMGPPPATPRARLDHYLRELEADLHDAGGATAAEIDARLAAEAAATALSAGLLPAVPAGGPPPGPAAGGVTGSPDPVAAAGGVPGPAAPAGDPAAAAVAAGWRGGPRLGAPGVMLAVSVAVGVAVAAEGGTAALVFGPPPVADRLLVAGPRTPPTPVAALLRAPPVPSSRWGALGGGIDPRRAQERAGGAGGDPG